MNRDELRDKILQYKDNLAHLGVREIIICRECPLEETIECSIPLIIKLEREDLKLYNAIQEFLSKNVSELIEVIPDDFWGIEKDEHFDDNAINIIITREDS
ncbi:MAG: hypothetical protein N2746_06505 [Deltaproteobacteria bacterium]|nr:hypothetical protein [Deltaproteobacteria bacterium]